MSRPSAKRPVPVDAFDEHTPANAEALFRSHAPFVARFLFRLGVAAEDLDDVVQEVFLVVHRHGGYVRSRATKMTYLASIALRAASSWRRRDRTQRARRADLDADQPSAAANPVEVLEELESMRRLQAALEQLAPELRATLALVDLEGQGCAAVAAGMRVPIGTVYWRLHRARTLFRKAAAETPSSATHEEAPLGDRRMQDIMAIFPFFSSKSKLAEELLRVGRARPPVRYDASASVARHQALVRAGAPLPPWADATVLATAKVAAGLATGLWIVGPLVLLGTGIVAGVTWKTGRPSAASAAGVVAQTATTAKPDRPGTEASGVTSSSTPSGDQLSPAATAAQPPPAASPSPGTLARVPARRVADGSRASPRGTLPASTRDTALASDGFAAGSRAAGPGLNARAGGTSAPVASRDPAPASSPAASSSTTTNTPPAPVPSPTPASAGPSQRDLQEMQEVATAGRLLSSDPARAFAIIRACEARFPNGYMRQERSYVTIMALFALGRRSEARADGARFLREYPEGTFSQRIRDAMAEDSADGH